MGFTIDIIRSGEANQNPDDPNGDDEGLSDEGVLQVEALVKTFITEGTIFPAIFTGPQHSTHETAYRLPNRGAIVKVRALREQNWRRETSDDLVKRSVQAFEWVKRCVHHDEHAAVVSNGLIAQIGMQALRNPNAPITFAETVLPSEDQLDPGQAQRMYFDDAGQFVREERIVP